MSYAATVSFSAGSGTGLAVSLALDFCLSILLFVQVIEISDIPLAECCRRVNAICDGLGVSNVILVSIHVNAAGSDGKWHKASGWSAYTTPGVTRADLLAYDLYEAAKKYLAGQKIRLFNGPKEPDFESNLYILKHTKCAAVLTENMFQDCLFDVAFLQSHSEMEAITMLHVEGIMEVLAR